MNGENLIGQVVHFVNYGVQGRQSCKAAIVTEVQDMGVVHLAVLGTNSLFFKLSVPYSDDLHSGTWHHRDVLH